jgi:hypothetical protein
LVDPTVSSSNSGAFIGSQKIFDLQNMSCLSNIF